MRKIFVLDDYFATGESTVQPVLLWGPGSKHADVSRVTKHASEALDYIKNVMPEPGKTKMLVLALGSEEAYGPNRNGDGFPERPVAAKHKYASDGRKWWIKEGETLVDHYKTFETNPARTFMHHQNTDPKKGSGHVEKAFWNPKMHRVELLIVVDNKKDPEWVQRVNDGEFPSVSMGCRIKHDICARCGNVAPTRAQYCDHVKAGSMNQVNDDGTKNYVHNPSPNFFDISRVFRPADRTGYTLKKVAHVYEIQSSAALGEQADASDLKAAAIRKVSDIEKIIRGEPVAAASTLSNGDQVLIQKFKDYTAPKLASASMQEIPQDVFKGHPLAEALASLATIKTPLTGPEFVRLIFSHLMGSPMPESLAKKTAGLLPTVLELFERSPALLDEVYKTGALDLVRGKESVALIEKLEQYKRASVGEVLYRNLVPEGIGIRPDAPPRTQLLNYHDPRTNEDLQTTRGAAQDAEESVLRSQAKKMIGGAGLLYGGYKLMGAIPSLRPWRAPAAIAGGYAALRNQKNRSIALDEGVEAPDMTEFAPQQKTAEQALSEVVLAGLVDYAATGNSSVHRDVVAHLEKIATVDPARGVLFDMDEVATALGSIVLP